MADHITFAVSGLVLLAVQLEIQELSCPLYSVYVLNWVFTE